jgi:DNA-binding MarR family transcriptional regulator
MTEELPWWAEVSLPALLRGARSTVAAAIRQALEEMGCADVPKNGSYVLGSIARNGSPLAEIISDLGVSKQAAGQLVDTLVVRGYLDRSSDPDDRRRMSLGLTERGSMAAAAIRAAAERIQAELVDRVGIEQVAQTRATLAALMEIGHRDHPPAEASDPRRR